MKDTFGREQERLWFPILDALGFKSARLTSNWEDHHTAADIIADGKRFGVRNRNKGRYSDELFKSYVEEFTIRYALPTGSPTEYHKIFRKASSIRLDYIAYGWDSGGGRLDYWFLVNVQILTDIKKRGYLKPFYKNIKRNTEGSPSSFLPISIPLLRESLPPKVFKKVFPVWSQDHPAFEPR